MQTIKNRLQRQIYNIKLTTMAKNSYTLVCIIQKFSKGILQKIETPCNLGFRP